MKFSTREDIEASIDQVYRAVVDFDRFERKMVRRGVDVVRDDRVPIDQVGATWEARFNWRGRDYDLAAELISIEKDNGYAIESKSSGVVCMGVVDLVALSKARTRLFVSLDLRPTTLSSRIFIQSLKLAKGSLDRRFKSRVSEFANACA